MLYSCPLVFYWPRLFSSFLHKGKASAAAVTLGNISLPVQVAHIRPSQLQVPCTPINPRWEKGSQCNAILWCFLHVWQISLFYLYYLLCFFRLTHLSNSRKFFGWEKKKRRKTMGVRIFMNVKGGYGRNPWSATNLCPVVLLWATVRHLDVCVTPPDPALFSRPVLYVFFLILGCTSGKKRLPSTPQYVPQWHFTRVLVRVSDECVSVSTDRDTSTKKGKKKATDQIRGAEKCLFEGKTSKRRIMMGDHRFSFPPCVDDLLCPDFVVLTACLCSFCHTKATSSASAHNCLIPHDAKLELFALLQMNMGILRRVQIAILI